MNKKEAYEYMLAGGLITNMYFSRDEFLFISPESDRIEKEDGYHMDNFWDSDYLPTVKWEKYED